MVDYALMNQHLYEGNAKEVEQMTRDALAEGRSVQEVMNEGLIAGMSVVGEDFKHNVLYVPEVLIAARAMKAGMAVLKPLLTAKDGSTNPVGVLLMGTVRGDLHDIGKNLVCMMAEGAGFEVHDIGVDQSVEKFLAAAAKCNPTIVGMSALLTTTMTYMKTVINGFEAAGLGHIKMAVGGAPISQPFANEIGAAPSICFYASRRKVGRLRMATYRILYWQEIPSQIKAEDDMDDVTAPMPDRFQERIDLMAAKRGLQQADEYLAQWKWSEEEEREGSAADVAEAVRAELEAEADW
ncbi:MAG: virulence factor [Candidatus Solibacter sp.]|nr:virulence factor [Candidatus Solibacter sp.]